MTDGTAPTTEASAPAAPRARKRPDVASLVLAALDAGPATSFEIAARVESARPGAIGQREGYLLPLLLRLRADGAADAAWADRADGRRRVYMRPGTPAPSPVPPGPAARETPTAAMREVADACTTKLAFAPVLAETAREELRRHLVDAAAARRRAGASAKDAEDDAIRAIGDPWKVSTDLARVAQGRRTVIFPRSVLESAASLVLYDAGILVSIVAVCLLARLQATALYHIPTKSMEPTLHGDRNDGDRILVLRLVGPPKRFDISVFDGWGDDRTQYVKRCVALPGEDVRIADGDLWIDGHLIRKDGDDLDAMLFPVFDADTERALAAREDRTAGARFQELWSHEGGFGWQQWPDGRYLAEARADGPPAELTWRERFEDTLYDVRDGARRGGITPVGDGRIELDVEPKDATVRMLLRWSRAGERCDAVLRGEQPGVAILVDGAEVARAADVRIEPGRSNRVRFSRVDRTLRLEIDGRVVLRHDLPEPPVPPAHDGPAAQVSLRVLEGTVSVLPRRLERDVHWTSEYESMDRARLGADEFFMLGDNSSNSRDCRSNGPVHRARLVGRPVLVLWPPSRMGVPK